MSQREKVVINLTLLVIILSLLYSFVLRPLYSKYEDLNQQIDIKRSQLERDLQLLKERNSLKQEFAKYGKILKAKGTEEEEMASVLAEIEKIGKSTAIYLSDVKPQKVKDMGFCRIMLVEIKFQSSMQTLTKFIYELQNSPFLLKASRLQVSSQKAGSDLLEGDIQISKVTIP